MYCKHCGKEIADDSKFCQHCGGKQDAVIDIASKCEKPQKVIKSSHPISDKNKKYILLYAIWFVLNLVLYCLGNKVNIVGLSATDRFFPFTQDNYGHYSMFCLEFYDITEFISYVFLIPLLIVFYFKYLHEPLKKNVFVKR